MLQIHHIELERNWALGPEIKQGGFGKIHEAEDENGVQAVIKLVASLVTFSRAMGQGTASLHSHSDPSSGLLARVSPHAHYGQADR